MARIKAADRLVPRTDIRTQRRLVTRLLVRRIVANYGHAETKDNVPWVTDEIAGLARTLKRIAPKDGW